MKKFFFSLNNKNNDNIQNYKYIKLENKNVEFIKKTINKNFIIFGILSHLSFIINLFFIKILSLNENISNDLIIFYRTCFKILISLCIIKINNIKIVNCKQLIYQKILIKFIFNFFAILFLVFLIRNFRFWSIFSLIISNPIFLIIFEYIKNKEKNLKFLFIIFLLLIGFLLIIINELKTIYFLFVIIFLFISFFSVKFQKQICIKINIFNQNFYSNFFVLFFSLIIILFNNSFKFKLSLFFYSLFSSIFSQISEFYNEKIIITMKSKIFSFFYIFDLIISILLSLIILNEKIYFIDFIGIFLLLIKNLLILIN